MQKVTKRDSVLLPILLPLFIGFCDTFMIKILKVTGNFIIIHIFTI